jgi:hypothetical protein
MGFFRSLAQFCKSLANFFKSRFLGQPGSATGSATGSVTWAARMGWRFVTYTEGQRSLTFQIEPMAKGADIVYLPDADTWAKNAPAWAKVRSAEIISRLQSTGWSRDLVWSLEMGTAFLAGDQPLPGSLESTSGGQYLEQLQMFAPQSGYTHAQAHEIWHAACEKFAAAASGRVTIMEAGVIPDSVFQAVELPALSANPQVTLIFR